MAVTVKEIANIVEKIASPDLAAEWDNIGLQVGDFTAPVHRIMVTLDVTEEVVDEAIELGIDLIVSHHPLIFRPLNHIRFNQPLGKMIIKLIRHNISLYVAHTNLDSAAGGVNDTLAEKLGLMNTKVITQAPGEKLFKLVVFVPESHLDAVRNALSEAGAGWIGNYSHCTFSTDGTGTFLPRENTNPFIGTQGKLEQVAEVRLETIVPQSKIVNVLSAMKKNHPYEEVAYDLYPLANQEEKHGLGRVGHLTTPMPLKEFLPQIKLSLGVNTLKVTGNLETEISTVAVCGGAGASLMHKAKSQGVQCFVTSDIKYHEAQEADHLGLAVVDAGHFFTEQVIVPVIVSRLSQEISLKSVQVLQSKVQTNPWRYF